MTTTPQFYCMNHRSTAATVGCDKCKRTYCRSCTKVRTFTYGRVDTCPTCEEPLLTIEIPIAGKNESIGTALISCVRSPLSDSTGRWTVFGAALSFGLFVGLTGHGLWNAIARVIATACLIGYAEDAIRRAARGQPGVPDWPQWTQWVKWVNTLMRTVFGLALVFAPAIYLFVTHQSNTLVRIATAAGALYWPMAWIAATMSRHVIGFSPHIVLPALVRTDKLYWTAVPFALLLFGGMQNVTTLFSRGVPSGGQSLISILACAAATYLMLVLGRVLGLVYLRTDDRFGW